MTPADKAAAITATVDTLLMQYHSALHTLRTADGDTAPFDAADDDFRRVQSIVKDLAGRLMTMDVCRCDRSDHDHDSLDDARDCYRNGGAL